MKKKLSKCLKINLIVWSVIFVVLTTAVLVYYFGATYPEFKKLATKSFRIPGLETKFVPQGMEFDDVSGDFLISGYMSNDEPSRIYVVDKASGFVEKYINLKVGEDVLKGHFGGITVYGEDAFVASDKKVYRFKIADLKSAQNGSAVSVIDSFETGNGADFILTYQDMLIVGEFYHQKKYQTRPEHHIKTSSGETNKALAYVYLIDNNAECGVASKNPEFGISLPDLVQGMSFTKNGEIVISTSYAIPSSKLYTFKNVLEQTPTTQTVIDGITLPVYELCENTKTRTIKAPAMAEELVLADDGKVYVLFESACKKYKLVNRTRTKYVYALDI